MAIKSNCLTYDLSKLPQLLFIFELRKVLFSQITSDSAFFSLPLSIDSIVTHERTKKHV